MENTNVNNEGVNNIIAKYYLYHSFSNWTLYKLDSEENTKKFIGFELEIDRENTYNFDFWRWINYNGNIVDTANDTIKENATNVYNIITSNINCVLMKDGSLSAGGIEIVSHPQTYNYIIAQKEKYKECFEKLQELGYTSHDNGRCGLHFHFTRPTNEKVVDRIVLIVENFKEEIKTFSRRTSMEWGEFITNYARIKPEIATSLYYIEKNKEKIGVKNDSVHQKRYHAVNTINPKTIEFRFNRGTLNIDTFIASLQLCNRIYDIANDTSIAIDTIDWLDLIKDEECFEYCKSKNIIASHTARDNSGEVIKKVDYLKLKVEKLKDILKDYEAWSIMNFKKEVKIRNIKEIKDINEMITVARKYTGTDYYVKELQRHIAGANIEGLEFNNLRYSIKELINSLPSDYYKHRFTLIYNAIKEAV